VAQREDLDLLGAFTALEQDDELEDAAEDEVQQGPEHEQRGCPLTEDAQAMNAQFNSVHPGFPTPQGLSGKNMTPNWQTTRSNCLSAKGRSGRRPVATPPPPYQP
jgi:hypothetical protein